MVKFFSPEFFAQVQGSLASDEKWQADTKGLRTSIKLTSTGQESASSYLLKVEEGATTVSAGDSAAQAEFSFEGPYDVWARVGKGELDFQSAVLKGQLKFKGSITKILFYKDRFMRIAEVMRGIPVEF